MLNSATRLGITVLEMLMKRRARGGSSLGGAIAAVVRLPFRAIAAFFTAPFLAFRVAAVAKNPVRRAIAGVGLFIAMLAGWFAGTFLGTTTAALLIAAKVGLFWGFAFFIGTTISVVLSVAFSYLVLSATSYFFLQMSSEDVVEYLRSISE